MDFNYCLLALLMLNVLLFSQCNLTVQAAESISGSPPDPIPPRDVWNKLKVVSKRIQASSPPSPRINAPYHLKSPPPSPRRPPPPSPPRAPPPPPSSPCQPPI
ncbi:formin-like protein 16 [Durio zibethinus]|uniref:Formin-like protein 16 n=1 Tax=Durio zibethinus TaxID=66656 RepID=A0A6P5WUC5_DURZI|nr:formin-like protein 16 [Durio zibethinus]